MRKLNDNWRLLRRLVLELGGLVQVVIVKTVAMVLVKISFRSENYHFVVGSVKFRFPECQKLIFFIISFKCV